MTLQTSPAAAYSVAEVHPSKGGEAMDDLERERLTRRHRDLMERARDAIEEARRVRNEFKPALTPAHIRSAGLSERTRALVSLLQEVRLWSQDARAKARDAVEASRAVSSRYDQH